LLKHRDVAQQSPRQQELQRESECRRSCCAAASSGPDDRADGRL
jgi:hypothetical protein